MRPGTRHEGLRSDQATARGVSMRPGTRHEALRSDHAATRGISMKPDVRKERFARRPGGGKEVLR